MDGPNTPILYVRLRKQVRLHPEQAILLGHVAQIIAEPKYEKAIQTLVLRKPEAKPHVGQIVLIDMLTIVKTVKKKFPELAVEHFGDPQVLVEWMPVLKIRKRRMLFPFVLILLFIGSGLTIMNFHADVSMPEVHRKLYKLITGEDNPHPYIMQIPYSFGLGAGMLLFFNRVFKKKLNEEPDPLEVEMFLYEENVRHYMVTEQYRQQSSEEERQ